jgi:hypothetical protein
VTAGLTTEVDRFSVRGERDAAGRRVTPVGELDLATAPTLQRECGRARRRYVDADDRRRPDPSLIDLMGVRSRLPVISSVDDPLAPLACDM